MQVLWKWVVSTRPRWLWWHQSISVAPTPSRLRGKTLVQLPYSGNSSRVKTFANSPVSGQFAKVLTMQTTFMEYGGRHYQRACHYSRQRRKRRDHGCCLSFPLACKAVFVQQWLPKPPRRHCSLDQRSPLRSSLAYSSCSHQFNLFRSFPRFRESSNHENLTFCNWQKFSTVKDPRYTVVPAVLAAMRIKLLIHFLMTFGNVWSIMGGNQGIIRRKLGNCGIA